MTQHTELKNQLRKEMGLDNVSHRMSVRNWVTWLLDHKDERVTSIARGLVWGVKTGRITNVNADLELLNPKTHKPLTNLQVLSVVAKAAVNQDALSAAGSVDALQKAMGKKVVVM